MWTSICSQQVPGRVTALVSGQPHLLTPGPLLGLRTAALAALLAVSAAPITSLWSLCSAPALLLRPAPHAMPQPGHRKLSPLVWQRPGCWAPCHMRPLLPAASDWGQQRPGGVQVAGWAAHRTCTSPAPHQPQPAAQIDDDHGYNSQPPQIQVQVPDLHWQDVHFSSGITCSPGTVWCGHWPAPAWSLHSVITRHLASRDASVKDQELGCCCHK